MTPDATKLSKSATAASVRRLASRLAMLLAASMLTTSLAVVTDQPVATAAPTISIRSSIVMPQPQLRLNSSGVTVRVTATIGSCPTGCALGRYGQYFFEEWFITLAEAPPTDGPVTLTATDRYEYDDPIFNEHYYLVRGVPLPDGSDVSPTHGLPGSLTEASYTYSGAWRREVNMSAGGTMISRSWQPGATASYTVPAAGPNFRQVGIVSARGPNNGVMSVSVDGQQRALVDLTATRWAPRQVVSVVRVQPGSVVTVRNATPAGRTRSDVHVDGLVLNHNGAGGQLPGPAIDRTRPGVELQFAAGQTLATQPTSAQVLVVGRTFGCPTGCSLTRNNLGTGVSTTLDTWTSPTAALLETRTARTTLSSLDADFFYLRQAAGSSATAASTFTYVSENAVERSTGWTSDANSGSIGGRIARTAVRGAGATIMPYTVVSGRPVGVVAAKGPRNGVMGIYVDGVHVRDVDLYATTWQPRRVVASVYLPGFAALTIVNRTPAQRTNADVHLDGFVYASDQSGGPHE